MATTIKVSQGHNIKVKVGGGWINHKSTYQLFSEGDIKFKELIIIEKNQTGETRRLYSFEKNFLFKPDASTTRVHLILIDPSTNTAETKKFFEQKPLPRVYIHEIEIVEQKTNFYLFEFEIKR